MTLALPNHRGDNDAEHSWSLSFLAISLAPEIDPSLDVGKYHDELRQAFDADPSNFYRPA